MKYQGFKKLPAPVNNYERLQYLQNRSYDKQTYNYNSLSKYNRSPYLQKIANQSSTRKKNSLNQPQQRPAEQLPLTIFKKRNESQSQQNVQLRSFSNNSNYQLPTVNNTTSSPSRKIAAFRLPRIDQDDNYEIQKQTAQSATLEFSSTKKKRLDPLKHNGFKTVIKTKSGTNGKQTKINQDVAFIQQKLPFGLKCFCVCDGHGLNGHIVSAFIKTHMIKNLTLFLRKQKTQPQMDKIQEIIGNVFNKTNQSLLDSDINTQLSGSTVVAVFQYKNRLFCFNVGDSRAILCRQVENNIMENVKLNDQQPYLELSNSRHQIKNLKQGASSLMNIKLSKSHQLDKHSWKIKQLSIDQKPERQDERQRVLKNGGRIECNRNQQGQQLGPLRVWMKDIQMPGLAMTRSFGDKAGLKAGTSAQPQIIQHEITPQDKYLIIASDGIWQYLQNDQVMNIVTPFYIREDIDIAAQKVVKLSTQIWSRISYSRDDITLIIVALNPANK